MTYRTKAAEELMDLLQTQSAMYEARVKKLSKPSPDEPVAVQTMAAFERGLYQGYLDSTNTYIEFARDHLQEIEQEAEMVPPPDAEKWLEQQMAGDFRDMPAA
jgi:hypothetical protein